MALSRKAQLLELLSEMAGGAAAGVLDVETASSTPMGLSWGVIAGALGSVAALALGPNSMGGMGGYIGDAAGGMLAFESGSLAAQWRINAKSGTTDSIQNQLANKKVGGRLGNRSHVVSQQDLFRSIEELERMAA
jgi:hypothetical protein